MRYLLLLFICWMPAASGFDATAQVSDTLRIYSLIPNDSLYLGKFLQKKNILTLPGKTWLRHKDGLTVVPQSLLDIKELDAAEAAAIDPGILYNPEESRQPAGIVIFPRKEIDPKMLVDPQRLKKRQ